MINCRKCIYYEKRNDIDGWNYCDFFEDLINEKTETHLDECFAYDEVNKNKEYILGFWSRYREEDDEPLYTVECFDIDDNFKTADDVSDWWYEWVAEDEYARDWDMLDLEFLEEVSESEKKAYEKDKRYDCRWVRNWSW